MFRLIRQFPGSGMTPGETITPPDDRFIYADKDRTYCKEDYFRHWSEFFQEIEDDEDPE